MPRNINPFALLLGVFASVSASVADTVLLPDSHHQRFQTYGLYIDQQSTLLYRDGGRGWGAIGGAIAVLENDELPYHPQLILHGSANAAFQINSSGDTLLTQTIDARAGLALDFEFDEELRGAVIWTHQSGHVADNIPDFDLFGSNLGNEIIDFRLIKDLNSTWRLGMGLRPTVGSDPGMIVFGAEEFAEYFPFGEGVTTHEFKPYLAVGLEQYGRGRLRESSNFEIGYAAGSHFRKEPHPSLRALIGYYNGNDPRLKYYQFKFSRQSFLYGGLAFDL